MPPQPHPPVAEGAWLSPRPARQSPDCRRGRVHRQSSRRPRRAQLKAAAFPAQHIRSALSQGRSWRCGAPPAPADSCGAPRPHAARSAVARLGRNTSRRRIGGISLASVRVSRRHRLRLVPPPLQPASLLHGTRKIRSIERILRAIKCQRAYFAHLRCAERAPQKRTCADSAQGKRRACHGARANPAPRGARRRRDGCDWRREASRPSQARRSGGWIAPRG